MVDKIDVILLPSVSSVYSFFFYCFCDFFFCLDFKKNCSFKSSFVDFFLVKLQVFVCFSLMRGIFNDVILFVDVLQISSFEGLILKFSIVYFLITMFVDVEVGVEFSYEMLMYGITSEPCTGKFHGIFGKFLVMLCFACFHVLEVDFKYLMVVVDLA